VRVECENGHRNKTFLPAGRTTMEKGEIKVEFEMREEVEDLGETIHFLRENWEGIRRALESKPPKCPTCGAKQRIIGAVALFVLEGRPTLLGTSEGGENIALRLEQQGPAPFKILTKRPIFRIGEIRIPRPRRISVEEYKKLVLELGGEEGLRSLEDSLSQ
jgi:hypothetical protein